MNKYREHAYRLADETDSIVSRASSLHDVSVSWPMFGYPPPTIYLPPDRDFASRPEMAYPLSLHEIGHAHNGLKAGPRSDYFRTANRYGPPRYDEEFAAWEWAKAQAIEWSPRMEAVRRFALRGYAYGQLMWTDRLDAELRHLQPNGFDVRQVSPTDYAIVEVSDNARA